MPHVAALYRHPIKGFTPESADHLDVQTDGRIAGDRVLAFRFPDALSPEDRDGLDYWPKGGGLCVRDFPSLVRLRLGHAAGRVRLEAGGEVLAEERVDDAGRLRLTAAVTRFLAGTEDADRLERFGPLTLVGDGRSARFQDRPQGFVSAHSRSSRDALAGAMGTDLDERRFRSNVSVAGLPAWAEDDLIGRWVRLGEVRFAVHAPINRCLATHANPVSGERDAPVLTTLTRVLGRPQPSFGILLVADGPGRISVGDRVEVLG
ncbi:MOSC domain-containing protein [Pseudactinotalea sp. HY160]|uniref:MOSC domain-containing protein n=1 Tax=Pseudactinotalea sp. HY160 TaxID=2654490 RepID=UPI00128DD77B|nr:MOSC domain-containing protein [Pseudactinotalea sp. HY160]MPV50560.1 MOSC domain-containing protein [Pseudactinotalea sp. HY160]